MDSTKTTRLSWTGILPVTLGVLLAYAGAGYSDPPEEPAAPPRSQAVPDIPPTPDPEREPQLTPHPDPDLALRPQGPGTAPGASPLTPRPAEPGLPSPPMPQPAEPGLPPPPMPEPAEPPPFAIQPHPSPSQPDAPADPTKESEKL